MRLVHVPDSGGLPSRAVGDRGGGCPDPDRHQPPGLRPRHPPLPGRPAGPARGGDSAHHPARPLPRHAASRPTLSAALGPRRRTCPTRPDRTTGHPQPESEPLRPSGSSRQRNPFTAHVSGNSPLRHSGGTVNDVQLSASPNHTEPDDLVAAVQPAFVAVRAKIFGDLISCRNDGKGFRAITGKVENVSEYSTSYIDMHPGGSYFRSCERVGTRPRRPPLTSFVRVRSWPPRPRNEAAH